ncbi:MAG TPA: cupin domain-containing protein [Acidimicrobiia bacterium]|nr:cupin domain-containing protein [Acidimicrobiia bacterium]
MSEHEFRAEMATAGHPVSTWANGAHDRYGAHTHPYRKILCCLDGSIVFHTAAGENPLRAGDRLIIEAGVPHSAIVGPAGVRCAEAHVIDT